MRNNTREKIPGTDNSAHCSWHLKAGAVLFGLSILVPIAGVPVIGLLKLGGALKTFLSGGVLLTGELLGIAAVAVMGKPGYLFLRGKASALLKRYGPPQTVSRLRYRIGLMLFCVPLFFGWVSVYIPQFLPGFQINPLPYAITGDFIFVTSLFVLGGDFWEKLQSLFQHNGVPDCKEVQDQQPD